MSWYSCHIVMSVRFKDGGQRNFPAWENIYLIEAEDSKAATDKAEHLGLSLEGDSSGTFEWDERPAKWVFAGVRKCMKIVHPTQQENNPVNGTELTYIELRFENEKNLKAFIEGDEVRAVITS